MFLRKIGWLSTNYMALYPRRQNSQLVSFRSVGYLLTADVVSAVAYFKTFRHLSSDVMKFEMATRKYVNFYAHNVLCALRYINSPRQIFNLKIFSVNIL
jgi:hypothetical protein